MRTTVATALLGLLLIPANVVHSAVRRVPSDHTTITAALAAAAPGDTVLVSAGTYSPTSNGETFPLQMTKNGIRLIGAGMDATMLDAEGTAGVIRHAAAVGGRISGFTLTGGRTVEGGGVNVLDGDVEIDHNRIQANGASFGGAGISVRGVFAPWIHHNLVLDNFATSASDVHALRYNQDVTGVFEHNLIAHTDGNGLLTVDHTRPLVRDNIFYRNGIPSPLRGRGICWLSDSSATIAHNLFHQNQVAALLWLGGGGDFSGNAANDFDPIDAVHDNLDGDPRFVDESSGDFHLLSDSPAIDAGDPSAPHDPDGTRADIGPLAFTHTMSVPEPPDGAFAIVTAPNPTRDGAMVRFTIPRMTRVRLEVVDLSGRLVKRLDDATRGAGAHYVRWDGADEHGGRVRSGIYLVRLRADTGTRVVRVAVIH